MKIVSEKYLRLNETWILHEYNSIYVKTTENFFSNQGNTYKLLSILL